MTALPGLPHARLADGAALPVPSMAVPRRSLRMKTWQISRHYHCSIIGTCLTTVELRQILIKVGEPDARTGNDHLLHSRGVWLAGQEGAAGKLLNKALDRRHESLIKRASRLSEPGELNRFWREAFDRGEIGGAYWAIMTHPAADEELRIEVFGEVHMLSHLVGSASRLDLARLSAMQRRLDHQEETMARQERRLAKAAGEHAALRDEIAGLQDALRKAQATEAAQLSTQRREAGLSSSGAARADDLGQKLSAARDESRMMRQRCDDAEARAAELMRENDCLERLVCGDASEESQATPKAQAVADGAILYVGGRRNLYDKLRALAGAQGVTLLLHDGGMEDSTTLLPAVLAKAEVVLFPVDHISHAAAGIIKRCCRESGKLYQPLRSAGLSSFVAAIGQVSATAGVAAE
jgi:hypothetical protein